MEATVPNANKPSRGSELRRLAEAVLETAGLEALGRLLTHQVPAVLGVDDVRLLVWNHKLDAFLGLTQDERPLAAWQPGQPALPTPDTGFLITDGMLLESPGGRGGGVLVPLIARSGVVGSWILGPPRHRRARPLNSAEARLVWVIASRSALALENHLYQKELIATERMAVLGTMAGMLAHDFRGPMTIIRGYAETLLDGRVPPDVVQTRAAEIVAAVDRLERMTAETVDFAREGGRLARRRLDVHKALDGLAHGLELELPGLTVVRRQDLPVGTFGFFDADKVQRAVGNIAANARDAMGGAGRLELWARLEAAEGKGPVLLALDVTDEGPGVPEEIRDRLFEPFVTRGKSGGTGLGLAVARRFIEDHGGTVVLLPEPGAAPFTGARFRIRVPLGPVPAPPAEEPAG